MNDDSLKKGISIVIPCSRPNEHLAKLLDSIYNQEGLNRDLIEVILVFNGHFEFKINEFVDILERLKKKFETRLLYHSNGSASKARNIGIQACSKEFICFCDDDDWIGSNYIKSLYEVADFSNIAFVPIVDVKMDGTKKFRKDINEFIHSSSNNDLTLYSRALTINASKLIPSFNAKKINFDDSLKSGEDVVYFCEYLSRFRPKLIFTVEEDCYYYRLQTEDSISRKPVSYEFNVEQRLDVIERLLKMDTTGLKDFFQSKVNAQLSFLNNYLGRNLDDLNRIEQSFQARGLSPSVVNNKFYINLS